MSLIFPDAGRIANIGHVSTQTILSTDKLQEYVIYVQAPKDKFFGSAFRYRHDGVHFISEEVSNDDKYVNESVIKAAIEDKKFVHVQHGSSHVFSKYAFKLGDQVQGEFPDLQFTSRSICGSVCNVQLYAVFFDRDSGQPSPHWTQSPEDGAIEVFYEYLSDGGSYVNNIASGDGIVADVLGVPGLKLPGLLISGPGVMRVDGNLSSSQNCVILSQQGPSLNIAALKQEVKGDWISHGDLTVHNTILRAKRASDSGLQTLVFAVINDDATSNHGITDAYALYRHVPHISSVDNVVNVRTTSRAQSADDGIDGVSSCDITFSDEIKYTSIQHPVYVRKLLTKQPRSEADPTRAQRMQLPPIRVSVTNTGPNGLELDGPRKLSAALVHRSMPSEGLGTRLFQMFSVLCRQDYCPKETCRVECDRSLSEKLDISQRLISEFDMSKEPGATHDRICKAINAFFKDPVKRVEFLSDFNSKFPNVLTSTTVSQSSILASTMAASAAELSLAVYLSMDFSIPDATCANGMRTNRLNDVPIIFKLV